jgi:hypothetical protein
MYVLLTVTQSCSLSLSPSVFVHPTQLWKWKNNGGSSKNSFPKNNENNKFLCRHNCCKLDGAFLLHRKPDVINSNCSYLMHPTVRMEKHFHPWLRVGIVAGERRWNKAKNTRQPLGRSTVHVVFSNSLWLKEESSLLLCWFFYLASWVRVGWVRQW